jgi:hypothetical protein
VLTINMCDVVGQNHFTGLWNKITGQCEGWHQDAKPFIFCFWNYPQPPTPRIRGANACSQIPQPPTPRIKGGQCLFTYSPATHSEDKGGGQCLFTDSPATHSEDKGGANACSQIPQPPTPRIKGGGNACPQIFKEPLPYLGNHLIFSTPTTGFTLSHPLSRGVLVYWDPLSRGLINVWLENQKLTWELLV